MNLSRSSATKVPVLDPATTAGAVTRGSTRLLADLGFRCLTEFKLTSKRRVDVAGLDKAGRFAVVEVKSSLADLRADTKWPEYLAYADWFYFAVDDAFPLDRLPPDVGIIVADAHGGAIQRPAADTPVNASRRRAQVLRFGLTAADRLTGLIDPRPR